MLLSSCPCETGNLGRVNAHEEGKSGEWKLDSLVIVSLPMSLVTQNGTVSGTARDNTLHCLWINKLHVGTSESTFIETDLFLKDRIIFLILYFFHLKEQTCTVLVCHCALGFLINYEWPPSLSQTLILLIAKRSKYQDHNRQKLIKIFILPLTFYI